eukprot:14744-Heterococcus_DN1.PRE.1
MHQTSSTASVPVERASILVSKVCLRGCRPGPAPRALSGKCMIGNTVLPVTQALLKQLQSCGARVGKAVGVAAVGHACCATWNKRCSVLMKLSHKLEMKNMAVSDVDLERAPVEGQHLTDASIRDLPTKRRRTRLQRCLESCLCCCCAGRWRRLSRRKRIVIGVVLAVLLALLVFILIVVVDLLQLLQCRKDNGSKCIKRYQLAVNDVCDGSDRLQLDVTADVSLPSKQKLQALPGTIVLFSNGTRIAAGSIQVSNSNSTSATSRALLNSAVDKVVAQSSLQLVDIPLAASTFSAVLNKQPTQLKGEFRTKVTTSAFFGIPIKRSITVAVTISCGYAKVCGDTADTQCPYTCQNGDYPIKYDAAKDSSSTAAADGTADTAAANTVYKLSSLGVFEGDSPTDTGSLLLQPVLTVATANDTASSKSSKSISGTITLQMPALVAQAWHNDPDSSSNSTVLATVQTAAVTAVMASGNTGSSFAVPANVTVGSPVTAALVTALQAVVANIAAGTANDVYIKGVSAATAADTSNSAAVLAAAASQQCATQRVLAAMPTVKLTVDSPNLPGIAKTGSRRMLRMVANQQQHSLQQQQQQQPQQQQQQRRVAATDTADSSSSSVNRVDVQIMSYEQSVLSIIAGVTLKNTHLYGTLPVLSLDVHTASTAATAAATVVLSGAAKLQSSVFTQPLYTAVDTTVRNISALISSSSSSSSSSNGLYITGTAGYDIGSKQFSLPTAVLAGVKFNLDTSSLTSSSATGANSSSSDATAGTVVSEASAAVPRLALTLNETDKVQFSMNAVWPDNSASHKFVIGVQWGEVAVNLATTAAAAAAAAANGKANTVFAHVQAPAAAVAINGAGGSAVTLLTVTSEDEATAFSDVLESVIDVITDKQNNGSRELKHIVALRSGSIERPVTWVYVSTLWSQCAAYASSECKLTLQTGQSTAAQFCVTELTAKIDSVSAQCAKLLQPGVISGSIDRLPTFTSSTSTATAAVTASGDSADGSSGNSCSSGGVLHFNIATVALNGIATGGAALDVARLLDSTTAAAVNASTAANTSVRATATVLYMITVLDAPISITLPPMSILGYTTAINGTELVRASISGDTYGSMTTNTTDTTTADTIAAMPVEVTINVRDVYRTYDWVKQKPDTVTLQVAAVDSSTSLLNIMLSTAQYTVDLTSSSSSSSSSSSGGNSGNSGIVNMDTVLTDRSIAVASDSSSAQLTASAIVTLPHSYPDVLLTAWSIAVTDAANVTLGTFNVNSGDNSAVVLTAGTSVPLQFAAVIDATQVAAVGSTAEQLIKNSTAVISLAVTGTHVTLEVQLGAAADSRAATNGSTANSSGSSSLSSFVTAVNLIGGDSIGSDVILPCPLVDFCGKSTVTDADYTDIMAAVQLKLLQQLQQHNVSYTVPALGLQLQTRNASTVQITTEPLQSNVTTTAITAAAVATTVIAKVSVTDFANLRDSLSNLAGTEVSVTYALVPTAATANDVLHSILVAASGGTISFPVPPNAQSSSKGGFCWPTKCENTWSLVATTAATAAFAIALPASISDMSVPVVLPQLQVAVLYDSVTLATVQAYDTTTTTTDTTDTTDTPGSAAIVSDFVLGGASGTDEILLILQSANASTIATAGNCSIDVTDPAKCKLAEAIFRYVCITTAFAHTIYVNKVSRVKAQCTRYTLDAGMLQYCKYQRSRIVYAITLV